MPGSSNSIRCTQGSSCTTLLGASNIPHHHHRHPTVYILSTSHISLSLSLSLSIPQQQQQHVIYFLLPTTLLRSALSLTSATNQLPVSPGLGWLAAPLRRQHRHLP